MEKCFFVKPLSLPFGWDKELKYGYLNEETGDSKG